jgi:opacity protein-like surface antigen
MKNLILILFLGLPVLSLAQLDLIEEEPTTDYTVATFKTNRLINGHSVEMVGAKEFDFKISHRFGLITGGFYDIFGLDQATVRFGGDFGITDRLNLGIGRSTVGKTYDGFVKYQFLRQSTGVKTMPVTAVVIASASVNTLRWPNDGINYQSTDRYSYVHQLLVARKFNENLSIQLMPSVVHRNLVRTNQDANTLFALGGGLRQKLTTRTTVNLEYYYVPPSQVSDNHINSLSVGFDIETGGHVFQLFLTNSLSPFEQGFITDTRSDWLDGDIHFGFNIARVFDLSR